MIRELLEQIERGPRGSDAREVGITVAVCATFIAERHGTSSDSRTDELRKALARVVANHLRASAVEFVAVAAHEAAHQEQRPASH
jgi:hypothetical protein